MKGIGVDIYKAGRGSCSNGGISAANNQAVLLGIKDGYIDPAEESGPFVVIVRRRISDYAMPCDTKGRPLVKPGMIGPMFGGTFIYSSDSRFREHCGSHAVALHDRWETQEQYDVLSR